MTIRPVIDAATLPSVRASARVKTVAQLLDCNESQVRRMANEGLLEAHTLGKRGIRIFLDSVTAYQERRAREAFGAPAESVERRARARSSTAAHRSALAELRRLGVL